MSEIKKLQKASFELSEHYRQGEGLKTKEERLAYLEVRFPATLAAISVVLKQLPFTPHSVLDIGSGPGTVWKAASSLWDQLEITCIEQDHHFIQIHKDLFKETESKATVRWKQADVRAISSFEPHDLVIFGYSYGEFLDPLEKYWKASEKALVIIEPGTPQGYKNILQARDALINLGGHVFAPCPHAMKCPLKSPEWCHFSIRLDRTQKHKLVKSASLPYEDEKYSYIIMTKEPMSQHFPRILHDPRHHKGHIEFKLCAKEGLQTKVISKRHKELFKSSKKKRWGDLLTESTIEIE